MTDKRIRQLAQIISIPLASAPGSSRRARSPLHRPLPGFPATTTGSTTASWSTSTPSRAQAGCTTNLKINPQLEAAAQRHTVDVLNNRGLDADIGSDGSSVADRARGAGYRGTVAETVAINKSLAINDLDVMGNWYYRPDYMAIMSNCANTQIGVWSENSVDRSVLVAVYGQPA